MRLSSHVFRIVLLLNVLLVLDYLHLEFEIFGCDCTHFLSMAHLHFSRFKEFCDKTVNTFIVRFCTRRLFMKLLLKDVPPIKRIQITSLEIARSNNRLQYLNAIPEVPVFYREVEVLSVFGLDLLGKSLGRPHHLPIRLHQILHHSHTLNQLV